MNNFEINKTIRQSDTPMHYKFTLEIKTSSEEKNSSNQMLYFISLKGLQSFETLSTLRLVCGQNELN